MRVVTLLPAATEIVAGLGDTSVLVGISHECDYPPDVQHLPRVTTTPIDPAAAGASIDRDVRRMHEAGQPVIALNAEQLRQLAPDLIIAQEQCEVCAVSDGQAHRIAATLQPPATVLSLRARDLAGVWSDIRAVGVALNLEARADELVLELQSRLQLLRSRAGSPSLRVLCIEWLDPLFLAGHWVPELVATAGGVSIGAQPGGHSTRRSWSEVAGLRPDLILVMLCGFGVDRARIELDRLACPEALELLSRVPTWIIDGNAYTSRGGPRVVDGAESIRSAIEQRAGDRVQAWQPAGVC
ncbi:MAG TPA: ABC transporter substrate-binding protein [Gemmatimonadales bacterium]|nr:ABC transporter substrate-binding protein [Gemmatimonadales bacterium]